jgi:hypothetical protein
MWAYGVGVIKLIEVLAGVTPLYTDENKRGCG